MNEMENDIIRIAICDDILEMTKFMTNIISDIMDEKKIEYEILAFQSGKDLLEQIDNVNLVFLDLEMPEMDGIKTGERIRRENEKCKIIVASAREDRMKEVFRLDAMRFVSKPYNREEIMEAIDAYLQTYQVGLQRIEVYKNRKAYYIMQREIRYIQAYNGAVNIYVRNTVFHKEVTLSKMEEMLDEHIFFKIHKAIIVGLGFVTEYTKDKVFIDKEILPLSRRNSKEFERVFMDFDLKYRG